MGRQSPLLGYNSNIRHKGKLYHIQTEDSGIRHHHVITHLFADGGRVIASKKSAYDELLGRDDLDDRVRELMRSQHKGMFLSLKEGEFDETDSTVKTHDSPAVDVASLDAAAARLTSEAPSVRAPTKAPSMRPAALGSIFGSDLLSEKSLDEVILSYLAEDLEEDS